jgi:hypothetical protein
LFLRNKGEVMADLVWSNFCLPNVNGASRVSSYTQCCSAQYEFSFATTAPAASNGSNYYPNNCLQGIRLEQLITIGPMKVDMEVESNGIEVDDDLIVNGLIYEEDQHNVNLGAASVTGFGTSFGGGMSLCNGRHDIEAGKLLATVAAGQTVTLGVQDNHGIDIILSGAIILRALRAP